MGWIRCLETGPPRILWLSGPAGTGKTALAGTIADQCNESGLLAAAFFFSASSSSVNRRSKKYVIPTLVYSLIQQQSIVGFKEEVLDTIARDPMVFEKHLDQQLSSLILNPLRKVRALSDWHQWPRVIIVDGLDECQESPAGNSKNEVLSALSRACSDLAFPFRIIVASRPESAIQGFFETIPGRFSDIFLDEKYDPDSDIRLFLQATFGDIRRRFDLPTTWPPQGVIDSLIKAASGQFIYVVTVIRFLDSPSQPPPQAQLAKFLKWRELDNSLLRALAPLDALYSHILKTTPNPRLAVKWLFFIDEHDLFRDHPGYIQDLLESYQGETGYVLKDLGSLVGGGDRHKKAAFDFHHLSFLDFLKDPQRCGDIYVSEEDRSRFHRDRYYEILTSGKGAFKFSPQRCQFNRILEPFLPFIAKFHGSRANIRS
ncbi:hypothetical protein FA13DRAFT_1794602 [Coprinellus micaceus]|uniref:NACHT domain-containing protein n=1 Tax=Coprinellus micaceus TaxID=71717 RepID=A0A4Y7T137_COPMI|nr:hypothetical protein FA13DRAFT_1794602 [Coprinellus micaceus]